MGNIQSKKKIKYVQDEGNYQNIRPAAQEALGYKRRTQSPNLADPPSRLTTPEPSPLYIMKAVSTLALVFVGPLASHLDMSSPLHSADFRTYDSFSLR